jgi:hypothetical protein
VKSQLLRGKATETIVGVIPKVSGHTFEIVYDLYFTEERLIAVLIQHPDEATDYRASFGWQSLFLGNIFSKRKEKNDNILLADERRSQNKSMTPSELAACHPGNRKIDYDTIAGVEIKTGFLETRLRITFSDPAFQVRSFGLTKKQAAEVRRLLELVLPAKLK